MGNSEDRVSENQKDLLWGMYLDMRAHARHAETLRVSAATYMLAVASALIAVISFDHKLDLHDLPLSILVSLIGLITALFCASYAELYFRNRERAERIQKRLDELFFDHEQPTTLSKLIDVRAETYRFCWARDLTGSTHWLWVGLPAIVFAVGIVLIFGCVVRA
jgi:hypothetical protein